MTHNKASEVGGNGGAILYNYYAPDVSDPENNITNNIAEFGPNVAGYASYLVLKSNPPGSDNDAIHDILTMEQANMKGVELFNNFDFEGAILIDLNQDFISG